MADERYTAEESRNLAVLIARIWADPQLADEYQRNPEAVLSGAGIKLSGRAVPTIPEKPAELAALSQARVAADSASSLSTITCPCTGCTASCSKACAVAVDTGALQKLADSPESRAQARKLMAAWGVNLNVH
jgi:hypothetical protein